MVGGDHLLRIRDDHPSTSNGLATPPKTPNTRATRILNQAALYQNSPALNPSSSAMVLDLLNSRKNESGWWLKRVSSASASLLCDQI
jgi:CLIP-associating protein 1/2